MQVADFKVNVWDSILFGRKVCYANSVAEFKLDGMLSERTLVHRLIVHS